MEIYNDTGKTKSGQLRVTKSIGALAVCVDAGFASLTNEKITIYIERSNGSNEEVCTNIPLLSFIVASTSFDGTIIKDGETMQQALCEIANSGSVPLSENEAYIISLTDLKSGTNYELHGIEVPVRTQETLFMTEKVLLEGQKNRLYDVSEFEMGILTGDFSKVRLTYLTSQGNRIVEYTKKELEIIASDFSYSDFNTIIGLLKPKLILPISLISVSEIEIFSESKVNLVLKDINKIN